MRTKGATSHVFVTLSQLMDKFQPDAIIPIARQFANLNGLLGKAQFSNQETIKATGNQPAVEEVPEIREIDTSNEPVLQPEVTFDE